MEGKELHFGRRKKMKEKKREKRKWDQATLLYSFKSDKKEAKDLHSVENSENV